jgi:hypothetical protein
MAEEEARAFWGRFSAHMEAHRGDLAGFARAEGLSSVHPEVRDGVPLLVASRSAPQRGYASAPVRRHGSDVNQIGPSTIHSAHSGSRKSRKKPR